MFGSRRIRSLSILHPPRVRRSNGIGQPGLEQGAVMVEFLIVFMPVFLLFLGVIQSGLLFVARVVVQHAATNTARAAAVVIGDDPGRYDGEPPHEVSPDGERYRAVRNAALITLSPLILNGTVQSVAVVFPDADKPGSPARDGVISFEPMGTTEISKVRTRLEVEVACRIPLVNWLTCPPRLDFQHWRRNVALFFPTQWVEAEAIYPYQGARYE